MISAGDGGGQDFELNLASIIDCLTVIIAFLLMSSSFVSFGAMDTAVAVPQAAASNTETKDDGKNVTLTLKLMDEEKVDWEVTGGSAKGGTREKRTVVRNELVKELEGAKSRYPGLQGVVLAAQPRVPYQQLIAAMDDSRKVFPAVILGVSQ
jgi:biopolymer transport protein ExbD